MTIRKARISRAVRGRVAQAAGEQCGYCRTPQHIIGHRLTIDHIIPEARGGKAVEENLWLACLACNQFKGARVRARDPITRRHVRLFNPRQQEWKACQVCYYIEGAMLSGSNKLFCAAVLSQVAFLCKSSYLCKATTDYAPRTLSSLRLTSRPSLILFENMSRVFGDAWGRFD